MMALIRVAGGALTMLVLHVLGGHAAWAGVGFFGSMTVILSLRYER